MGKDSVEEFAGVLQSSSRDLVSTIHIKSTTPWTSWDPLRKYVELIYWKIFLIGFNGIQLYW